MIARRLPGFDEVRAARAHHLVAHHAHHAIHPLNDLLEFHQSSGALPADAEATILSCAAGYPDLDRPDGALLERATALRDGLLPHAREEKQREDALEKLLYAQYQTLISDESYADIRAILDPLYAERSVLFDSLAPRWHDVRMKRAALEQFVAMRAHMKSDESARVIGESLVSMLIALKIERAFPSPYVEASDEWLLSDYLAEVDAWYVEEHASVEQLNEEAQRQYARWKVINETIESHTG